MIRHVELLKVTDDPPSRWVSVEAKRPARDAEEVGAVLGRMQDVVDEAGDRTIVLIGSGDAFFLADVPLHRGLLRLLAETCASLSRHPMPVLAAIDAPALGAGLELALACDLRFARRGTPLGFPRARDGLLPAGGCQRLIAEAGLGLATRLLLLGDVVRAGAEPVVESLVEAVDDPSGGATAAADDLAASGPLALQALKAAILVSAEMPPQAGFAIEADLAALLLPTADRAEGLQAFRDRRPPRFEGQ